jgi:hypothetical protein
VRAPVVRTQKPFSTGSYDLDRQAKASAKQCASSRIGWPMTSPVGGLPSSQSRATCSSGQVPRRPSSRDRRELGPPNSQVRTLRCWRQSKRRVRCGPALCRPQGRHRGWYPSGASPMGHALGQGGMDSSSWMQKMHSMKVIGRPCAGPSVTCGLPARSIHLTVTGTGRPW